MLFQDGNDGGICYYTRNMEDNGYARFPVQVEMAFLSFGDTILVPGPMDKKNLSMILNLKSSTYSTVLFR